MEAVLLLKFLLLKGTLITAAVNTQMNFTAEDVEQDIFSSICSFRGSCNSRDFYTVFKERDSTPTNTRSMSIDILLVTIATWTIHLLTSLAARNS